MSMRSAAVRLAGKGLRVFRLRAGTKGGAGNYLDANWTECATCDPLAVYDLWTAPDGGEASYNIGVLTTGYAVLDVDDKKGKRGSVELAAVVAEIGALPPTYTVETPSGGKHYYFRGDGFNQRDLADGVNIRATHGYVLGAGSIVDGRPYRELSADLIADVPQPLAERLRVGRKKDAAAGRVVGTLDLPQSLAAAWHYIEHEAPSAEEGSRGSTAFRVACRLFDLGVSLESAAEIMNAWADAKTSPRIDDDELTHSTQNALKYRRQAVGAENPIEGFEPYEDECAPNPLDALVKSGALSAADIDALPPRPWISRGYLMRGKLTTIVAPGSAGKSLLTLQWAVALAGAHSACSYLPLAGENYRVLMVNGEDDEHEQRLRLAAVSLNFGIDLASLGDRLRLLSVSDHPMTLIRKLGPRGAVQVTEALGHLEDYITRHAIDVVCVDPLIEIHEVEENSNSEMRIVMQAMRGIAARTNCAVILVHHTNKLSGASSEGHAGSHVTGRGASAVKDASRINLTLFPMSEKDAETLEVLPADRRRYVRLDDAKMNHTLEGWDPRWFEKVSVEVGAGGESVGVLVPWQPSTERGKTRQYVAELLAPYCMHEKLSVKAAARLLAEDRMFQGQSQTALAKRIRDLFLGAAVVVSGRQIVFEPDGASGGDISTTQAVN